MSVEVQRQATARNQAAEGDWDAGDERHCQDSIFQPGELSIKRGGRWKHSEEVVEQGHRSPRHDELVEDSESSQEWWNCAFEKWSPCDETAKNQGQQPCVGIIRPQHQDPKADDKETQGVVGDWQVQQIFQASCPLGRWFSAAKHKLQSSLFGRRARLFNRKLDNILLADDYTLVERTQIFQSVSVYRHNPVSGPKTRLLSRTMVENNAYLHGASACRILIARKARLRSRVPHMHDPEEAIGRGQYGEKDRQEMAH